MDKTVLCYLEKDHRYLMLFRNKKKKDINKQKWIGVGGHLENEETKEAALIREVKEETGFLIHSFNYRGEILFVYNDIKETMYLYTSSDFSGDMIDCNEGTLEWIDLDDVMSLDLWEGDRIFLPILMNTKDFINLELYYQDDKLVKVIDRGIHK